MAQTPKSHDDRHQHRPKHRSDADQRANPARYPRSRIMSGSRPVIPIGPAATIAPTPP